ncbi:heparan-alpha-glucosaminide N-acetyltransferase domain-containing protein [Microbacterium koreense]|uniref:Heparan-alpha-glucosaminide N-acetyltransferase domain-containing protein n=1 Tax=Microbacterium koreense TaxID=323761 RepID=A0ABW2ZTA1_9MICO
MVAAAAVKPPSGWWASRWRRLNGGARIHGVDLARGLAIVGMLAAHLIAIETDFSFGDPSSWIAVVDGRSSILFATLAGVSLGLVTGGATPLRAETLLTARARIVIRAFLIWFLGLMLIELGVPVFVILPAYAILFLLSLPFLALSARTLLVIAAALAAAMPFVVDAIDRSPLWATPLGNDLGLLIGWHYPFPVWLAFVLVGIAVARAGITRLDVQLWALGGGLALALVGYGTDALLGQGPMTVWTADPHSSGVLEIIGSGGFALAVLATCLLVCRGMVTWVVLPLRAVGSMPLSAYTAQIVAWALVASIALDRVADLAGFRALDPFWPMTLALIATATLWALAVGRGPLEWVLDRLTRLVRVPSALNVRR